MDDLKAALTFGRTCGILWVELSCERPDHPVIAHCGIAEITISNDSTWSANLEKVTCEYCRRHFEALGATAKQEVA